MKIRIGTLNCQNNLENRSKIYNALILVNHIQSMNYNILGMQELTINLTDNLVDQLNNYNFYGNFQYGSLLLGRIIPLVRDYNQANKIITNYPILKKKTYALPWFPFHFKDFKRAFKKMSMMPRLATFALLKVKDKNVYVINVHLDYYVKDVQQRQLNYLLKIIKKVYQKGSIVLMGDFNLDLEKKIFLKFVDELKKLDILRVPLSLKTNSERHKNKSSIDHIFLSKDFNVLDYGIMDLSDITDHKAIYVDADLEEI